MIFGNLMLGLTGEEMNVGYGPAAHLIITNHTACCVAYREIGYMTRTHLFFWISHRRLRSTGRQWIRDSLPANTSCAAECSALL